MEGLASRYAFENIEFREIEYKLFAAAGENSCFHLEISPNEDFAKSSEGGAFADSRFRRIIPGNEDFAIQ